MNALDRVKALKAEGKTGQKIAQVLLSEDFSIQDAKAAFYSLGYVVDVESTLDDKKFFM